MVTIIFESHANSVHNEQGISSGTLDPELSESGKNQAKDLGARYANDELDVVFCSPLKRSLNTVEIAFEGKDILVYQDSRLNECNYGQLNGHPASELETVRLQHITEPFPGGDSYGHVVDEFKSFLNDLYKNFDGKRVMIVGHRATQYGLEHWINKQPLAEAIAEPWKWRPGWVYLLEGTV